MNNLLAANFARLKKNKYFWLNMLVMAFTAILFPIMRYLDMKESGWTNTLDNGFFTCAVLIGVLNAVFSSFFIGAEYSDGPIRNKIIAGKSRISIYLSNLLTSAIAALLSCAIFFVLYLCVGIPLLGFFTVEIKTILLFIITVLFLALAFSSLFTMIASLVQNKALTVLLCVLIAFFLLIAGSYINARLSEPETYPAISYTMEEGSTASEMKNPHYLQGSERELYQFLYDFLPGGQAVQCAVMEAKNPPLLWLYSWLLILASTGLGLCFFQRKDIK